MKRRFLNWLLRMAANENLTCDRVPPFAAGDVVARGGRAQDSHEFLVKSGPRYELVYTTDPPGYQRTSEHEFNLILVRRAKKEDPKTAHSGPEDAT